MPDDSQPTWSSTEDDARPARSRPSRATSACLFRLLEADAPLAAPARTCLRTVAAATIGRRSEHAAEADDTAGVRRVALGVPDRRMSQLHAQLRRADEGWVVEDARSKNGTFVNGCQVERHVLADGDLIEAGHTFFLFRKEVAVAADAPLHLEGTGLHAAAPGLATLHAGLSAEVARLCDVAASKLPVVIRGETGTGKELVASAVHALSGRTGALVAVNCAALPDSLVVSELFGSKKGTFTGAVEDRPGLVRSAHGGTLFLDEVGELSATAQATLLRVLAEAEVTPIGASRPIKVDARLVVATHRDLEAMARAGAFRPDLLARIAGLTVRLPPLRERREDLGLIVAALLRRHAPDPSRVTFRPEAARLVLSHRWPLNIRELEKALAAAVLLAKDGPIEPEHLPEDVQRGPAPPPAAGLPPEENELRDRLVALLAKHEGNVAAAARELGKARTQVHRYLNRFGIDPAAYRRR